MRKLAITAFVTVATLSQPLASAASARPPSVERAPLASPTSPGAAAAVTDQAQPGSGLDWCAHTMGGPGGSSAIPVDLSAAHNLVREFSVTSRYTTGDAALAKAIGGPDPFGRRLPVVLAAYDRQLEDTCVLASSSTTTLGRAHVTKSGNVAIIRPGSGRISLPAGTDVVVVDLRNLPAVAGLYDAVARAAGTALTDDVEGAQRTVRTHDGPVDEALFPVNAYTTGVATIADAVIHGTATQARPLVFLTGTRTAPDAAAVAGCLRLAGHAWVIGEDLYSESAEADWRGVGASGLAVRTSNLVALGDHTPTVLTDQVATQDDPLDPTTASYRHEFSVPDGTFNLSVKTDGEAGNDLDLYLLRDVNGDGQFVFPDEFVAVSAGATADEQINLVQPPPGAYQAWVHGYSVPSGTTTFDITVDAAPGELWPDLLPRDHTVEGTSDAAVASAAQSAVLAPPAELTGAANRTKMLAFSPFGDKLPPVPTIGTLRADLLIAHGMLRRWFPYFDVVGDTIDDRLLETLEQAEAINILDRVAWADVLRHLTESIHDGHSLVFDFVTGGYAGYLAAYFDTADGHPVVRNSAAPGFDRGDVVMAVNGVPIDDYIAQQSAFISAATPGFGLQRIWERMSALTGPTPFTVQDPDGTIHNVVAQPMSGEVYSDVYSHTFVRPNGSLADLGAADIHYLNMSGGETTSIDQVEQAVADAQDSNAAGLIVDMRDYPAVDHYAASTHLLVHGATSAQFAFPTLTGPDQQTVDSSQYSLLPAAPVFTGPIVLLTGNGAVSAAENFMMILVGAHRLTSIVGRQSAGTNGNITSMVLPGGFVMSYTGMQVLFPDGSQFDGIGIVPDVPVALDPAAIANGVDQDINAAIAVLQGG